MKGTRSIRFVIPVLLAALLMVLAFPGFSQQQAFAYDGNPAGEVAWAKAQVGKYGWYMPNGQWQESIDSSGQGWCARFVGNAYGANNAGGNAVELKNEMKKLGRLKTSAATNAPTGALVFFNLTSFGHVGIYVGNGYVVHAGVCSTCRI